MIDTAYSLRPKVDLNLRWAYYQLKHLDVNNIDDGSARELMAHETLRTLAQLLVQTIRASATIDWTRKEGVRAKMRIEVRKLLARYGYPPDLQKAAVDLVVRQAEAIAAEWG